MNSLISQLSHVCFSSNDLGATRHFYESVLGFEVVHEFRSDKDDLYGIYFSIGRSTFLEFFKDADRAESSTMFRHVCFSVGDIHALNAKLQEFGIAGSIQRGRTDQTLQMWIMDPNGIKIEFHEYDPQSLLTKYQE